MNRIKVKSFLDFTPAEGLDLITRLQKLRTNSLEEARTKKAKGLTKSARRNLKKRKSTIDPEKAALNALNKLSPEQIQKMKEIFG